MQQCWILHTYRLDNWKCIIRVVQLWNAGLITHLCIIYSSTIENNSSWHVFEQHLYVKGIVGQWKAIELLPKSRKEGWWFVLVHHRWLNSSLEVLDMDIVWSHHFPNPISTSWSHHLNKTGLRLRTSFFSKLQVLSASSLITKIPNIREDIITDVRLFCNFLNIQKSTQEML